MQKNSLYIHIPFCGRKCLFCSFVIAVGQEHRREDYVRALALEMKKHKGAALTTIYFGGGTPSLLEKIHFESLMRGIRDNFLFNEDIEICIEANPETISMDKARFFKDSGINRVSLGVQSLNDRYLKFLGRTHDAARARSAYDMLREAGFANINLDLMYGFPGQTTQELQDDVSAIASMGSEHLSLYTLTIEPRSRFFADQMKLDDDEKLAGHYLLTIRCLKEHGFRQYEVSNFAKPSRESVHNKNYWLGVPYIGLGMGAHGFDGRQRHWNVPTLSEYLKRIDAGGEAVEGFEDLSDHQLAMEKLLFGLRMNKGVAWQEVPAAKHRQIEEWISGGFLVRENDSIKTTDAGRLVLDELSSRLI